MIIQVTVWRRIHAQMFGLLLLLIAAVPLLAQSSIHGLVTDASGAAVPGTNIKALNAATNVTAQTTTNDSGFYEVPSLLPGTYSVTAIRDGFDPASQTSITLHVSDKIAVDFELKPGSTSSQVTVMATLPLVNSSSSSLGQVIENRQIVDLPLDGRDPLALANLSTGVVPVPPNANIHQGDNTPSINGAANFTSEVMIDGVPDTAPRNGALDNFLIYTPTVDGVQEFRVETNSLGAEFGRFNGGVINLVMKSGSNAVHGSVYEFIRNSAADANYYFNKRTNTPLAPLKRNQFGFSVGGPVVLPWLYNGRNKTFFFGDFEGYRETLGTPATFTVPTALERQGDFSQTRTSTGALIQIYDPATLTTVNGVQQRSPFPGNKIPASRLNPVALKLASYYPLPNNSNLTANFALAPAVRYTNNTGDVRIDQHFGDREQMFVRASLQYPYTGSANYYGNIGNAGNPPLQQERQAGTFHNQYTISPSMMLETAYGIIHQYGTRTAWSDGFDITTLGFDPTFVAAQQVKAIPVITISNISGIGNGSQNYSAQLNHSLINTLTMALGRHTIRTGVDFRVYYINQLQNPTAEGALSFSQTFTQGPGPFQTGATSGNGFAAFLLGIPGGSIAIQPAVASKSTYIAEFIQDDWRVSSKLTINAGVRYDISIPRTERFNRFSLFQSNVNSPIAGQVAGFPNLKGAMSFGSADSRKYADTDLNNFAPRLGLEYQVMKNTVIGAAYAIIYGLAPSDASGPGGGYVDGFTGSTTINTSLDGATPIVELANPFPGGINQPLSGSQLKPSVNLGQTINSVNLGQPTPYLQNWKLSVERSIGSQVVVKVAYAANKGTKLPLNSAFDLNSLTTAQYYLGAVNNQQVANPFYGVITDSTSILSKSTVSQGQLLRPYPQYTNVYARLAPFGSSIYHSMQVSVEKRFSGGFSLLGSFTAAKLIDNTSAAASGTVISTIQDPTNLRAERTLDTQDVAKRLVISSLWDLPIGRGRALLTSAPRAVDLLLGGWQINGIASFQGGQPLVMTSIGASGLRPNVLKTTHPLGGPIQKRLTQYFDTTAYAVPAAFTYGNSPGTAPNLRTPGIANYDGSLMKNFKFEHITAQLRAETFNLFNRVQFSGPGTQAGSTSFGIITTQANTPRQIQLALKLLF